MDKYLTPILTVDAVGIIDKILFGPYKPDMQPAHVAEACRTPPFNWFVDSIQPIDYVISEIASLDLM